MIEYVLREAARWLAIMLVILLALSAGCAGQRDALLAEDDALLSVEAQADALSGDPAKAGAWKQHVAERNADRLRQKGN